METEFRAFIDQAFADIAARGSEILIVDISANGGGAHMLSDHLLAYLTTQRHTPLSAVTARITEQNQALIPGSQIGDVMSMPFARWVEPPAELANRFTGRTAFLVGAGTYSQAIVLAATVQDFGIAPVAGPGTQGRANSTGQVQLHRLTHTGLEVAAPIYVFIRPSGDTSSAPVIPDIPLEGPRETQIDALIAQKKFKLAKLSAVTAANLKQIRGAVSPPMAAQEEMEAKCPSMLSLRMASPRYSIT